MTPLRIDPNYRPTGDALRVTAAPPHGATPGPVSRTPVTPLPPGGEFPAHRVNFAAPDGDPYNQPQPRGTKGASALSELPAEQGSPVEVVVVERPGSIWKSLAVGVGVVVASSFIVSLFGRLGK